MIPGEYRLKNEPIIANPNRRVLTINVANASDRPVQVGSHFHFFEVNRGLQFDRQLTFGMRLNIPAGTAVRFEPGDSKRVELTELAGSRSVYGLNSLTEGSTTTDSNKSASLARAKQREFLKAE